jgi:hypothetical protein
VAEIGCGGCVEQPASTTAAATASAAMGRRRCFERTEATRISLDYRLPRRRGRRMTEPAIAPATDPCA